MSWRWTFCKLHSFLFLLKKMVGSCTRSQVPTFPKNLSQPFPRICRWTRITFQIDCNFVPVFGEGLHYQCIIGATREAIFNAFSDDCFIIIKNHKTISANVPTSANVPSTRLSWLRQSNGRILVFIELEVQVFSIICLTTGFLILA